MTTKEETEYRIERRFDLTEPLPMAQGMALKGIMASIGGKVLEFAEAGTSFFPGLVYYLKAKKGGGEAESLWYDDGLSVTCLAYNLGQGWTQTEIGKGIKVED